MHYEIARNSKRCCVSGRPLEPGEFYYSALVDMPGGLQRRDYAVENWTGPPEDTVGFWKGRLPGDNKPAGAKPVTIDTMMQRFVEWYESGDEQYKTLLYVLTLLLIRKKALKLQDVERSEEQEYLIVQRPREKNTYRVCDPHLPSSQVQEVERELDRLLGADENDSRTQP